MGGRAKLGNSLLGRETRLILLRGGEETGANESGK